jgi:hypothetical protein
MESSTIALIIRYFNIASTAVLAFFAIYGIIIILGRNTRLNAFRGKMFWSAFCVASLLAFAVEVTFFNFQHYLKYIAGGEVHTLENSPQNPAVILTSDGTAAEMFSEKKRRYTALDSATGSASDSALKETALNEKDSIPIFSGIVFKNLNRRVVSIFIDPVFDSTERISALINVTDESGTHVIERTFYKGMPHTNHIPLLVCGKTSELGIMFAGAKNTGVSRIAINRQIPFYFSGLRLFVVSMLFFTIILFAYKPLRAKTAYLLFEYRFNPADKKQNLIYAFSVISLIIFSWICAYTSIGNDMRPYQDQYNKYLVDALIAGRTNLEAGNPEKMLKAEQPYNWRWLEANGYKKNADWFDDWVFYKGKFYCYFGVVPAILLYVPYKLITGDYLSNQGGIFLFVAISVILLARLWRFFVKKYMPNVRFMFYLLSFLTLFFASGLFAALRFTKFYSIVSVAGFMFVVAGLLLLFESVEREKPCRVKLFFACLCLALAVGCRPNMLFVSFIVLIVVWKQKLWKYLPLIAIPYIMVAIPLCIYNYARFGSIFDFGYNYNMTLLSMTARSLIHPIGRIINTFIATISYLFIINKYSFTFPYVECLPQYNHSLWEITQFYDRGYGMINFPIVFCLFFFFKNIFVKEKRPKTFYLSAVFLFIAAILILVISWSGGVSGRYTSDFAIFIILPSLFSAYYWCDGNGSVQTSENQNPIRRKVTYILLAVSIFVGLFLFMTRVTNGIIGETQTGDPVLYYYLRQSLALLGTVWS